LSARDAEAWCALRQSKTSGRPFGNAQWLAALEQRPFRKFQPRKRGLNPKELRKLAP
jgi:hypothetical protein